MPSEASEALNGIRQDGHSKFVDSSPTETAAQLSLHKHAVEIEVLRKQLR